MLVVWAVCLSLPATAPTPLILLPIISDGHRTHRFAPTAVTTYLHLVWCRDQECVEVYFHSLRVCSPWCFVKVAATTLPLLSFLAWISCLRPIRHRLTQSASKNSSPRFVVLLTSYCVGSKVILMNVQ
jgi:hypothetical protein